MCSIAKFCGSVKITNFFLSLFMDCVFNYLMKHISKNPLKSYRWQNTLKRILIDIWKLPFVDSEVLLYKNMFLIIGCFWQNSSKIFAKVTNNLLSRDSIKLGIWIWNLSDNVNEMVFSWVDKTILMKRIYAWIWQFPF